MGLFCRDGEGPDPARSRGRGDAVGENSQTFDRLITTAGGLCLNNGP